MASKRLEIACIPEAINEVNLVKKTPFLVIFCMLFVACNSNRAQIDNVAIPTNTLDAIESVAEVSKDDPSICLEPIETFAYQLGEVPPDFVWSEVGEDALPIPSEWQDIIHIPDTSSLMLIRTTNAQETEIWLDSGRGTGFVRYRQDNYQPGNGKLLDGPERRNAIYFADRNNSVWAARAYTAAGPLFSRYNDQTEQWEDITVELPNQNLLGFLTANVDNRGTIWLTARYGTRGAPTRFFSLDPTTMRMEQHLTDYAIYPTFAISQETIFLLADNVEKHASIRYILIRYSIATGAVTTYKVPPQYNGFGGRYEDGWVPETMFVDQQQRVWLGARGWIDLSIEDTYRWHFALPNPIFIDLMDAAGMWVWSEPRITAETPDGKLWYSTMRGSGWVDPEAGEWCIFTSDQSNILVDGQGNLWMLVNERLYKRK